MTVLVMAGRVRNATRDARPTADLVGRHRLRAVVGLVRQTVCRQSKVAPDDPASRRSFGVLCRATRGTGRIAEQGQCLRITLRLRRRSRRLPV